jgi:hypothetical protein
MIAPLRCELLSAGSAVAPETPLFDDNIPGSAKSQKHCFLTGVHHDFSQFGIVQNF